MSPLFYITDNAVRSTVRPVFPLRKKTAFPPSTVTVANPLQYPSRLLLRASPRKPQNPVDSSSRFSYPKKNGVFRHQRGMTATNRCNTRSAFLLRASPRKPKNPVDSSSRFSYPKKNGFPAINRHGSKPVAIPVQTSLPRLSPQAEKSGRQFAPLFLSEKKRFSCNQPSRWQTRCNTRPDFSSVPLPASRKIRLTVRPAFPLRKKTAFLQSTGTAANPLQYPSRLLRPLTINGLPCFV